MTKSVTKMEKMPFRTYAHSGDFYRIVPLDARCMIGSIRHRIAGSCKSFNYDPARSRSFAIARYPSSFSVYRAYSNP